MKTGVQTTSKADRMWSYPAPVGRRPRRAHGLANSLRPDRAGFEPCPGSSFAPENARYKRSVPNGSQMPPTPSGSNPARSRRFRDSENLGRAEIFALPLLDYEPHLT
jgi:hypothetical protein